MQKAKINKLFELSKIQKFFSILRRTDRHNSKLWINSNARSFLNDEPCYYCAREVFVNRTIKKWFSNRFLILYGETYKEYIYVSNIRYALTWGEDLQIYIVNYNNLSSNPTQCCNYDFNQLYNLEGIWCPDGKEHYELLEFLSHCLPDLSFEFLAYDLNKLKTVKAKKGEEIMDKVSFKYKIIARTEQEAFRIKSENTDKNIMITDNYTII